jgi:hypothetical protein
VIKCSDFIDADEAAVTIGELCQSMRSENNEESDDSDEEGVEDPHPISSFGEVVSSFEVVRRFLCFYKISDARLEHLERELLFIHHTQPAK